MKRFQKIYVEISNICDLRCSFCPGTRRPKRAMTEEEFSALLPKLKPWTDFLYFHLMGEPLCHPKLGRFLELAGDAGFRVILTTNGNQLEKKQELLLSAPALHKVNISLHAFEANDLAVPFRTYLERCIAFGKAAEGKKIVVFRLWNEGGKKERNAEIEQALADAFPGPWREGRKGTVLGDRVFLEHGDKFDWPDLTAPEGSGRVFCYGLRDQLGILCDGTAVPCCLDHDGDLALGNIFSQSMEDILAGPRAKAIYEGFRNWEANEELCRKCGYARRFG